MKAVDILLQSSFYYSKSLHLWLFIFYAALSLQHVAEMKAAVGGELHSPYSPISQLLIRAGVWNYCSLCSQQLDYKEPCACPDTTKGWKVKDTTDQSLFRMRSASASAKTVLLNWTETSAARSAYRERNSTLPHAICPICPPTCVCVCYMSTHILKVVLAGGLRNQSKTLSLICQNPRFAVVTANSIRWKRFKRFGNFEALRFTSAFNSPLYIIMGVTWVLLRRETRRFK